MPQVHTYLPQAIAAKLRSRAAARGLSLSRYLAQILSREVEEGWPPGFFETVVGGWRGEPLQRPDQGELEPRDEL